MTKLEFLSALRKNLSGLPEADIDERLAFYAEAIDDRVEDGFSEDEAVAEMGNPNEVAIQIIKDTPITKIVKERVSPKRSLKAWEIILIILGAPIWLSLLIAVFAVLLSVWVAVFSVVVSLWAVAVSLVAMLIGGIAAGVVIIVKGGVWQGIALLGAGLACAGVGILLFIGCLYAVKGIVFLTKKIAVGLKKAFIRKEEDQ